jgi:hypothetical protein
VNIKDLQKYNPQKVFILQGDKNTFEETFTSAKKEYDIVQSLSVPRFSVDYAEEVVRFVNETSGSERIIIVYFSVFSPESAHVLLKSLEEPDPFTTVILVTPYPYMVPQTIRSRVIIFQNTLSVEKELPKKSAMESFVKNEFGSESGEDPATKRAKAVEFLDVLENTFKKDAQKSNTIYEAKKMLFKANIPTKYVMEYVVSMLS